MQDLNSRSFMQNSAQAVTHMVENVSVFVWFCATSDLDSRCTGNEFNSAGKCPNKKAPVKKYIGSGLDTACVKSQGWTCLLRE